KVVISGPLSSIVENQDIVLLTPPAYTHTRTETVTMADEIDAALGTVADQVGPVGWDEMASHVDHLTGIQDQTQTQRGRGGKGKHQRSGGYAPRGRGGHRGKGYKGKAPEQRANPDPLLLPAFSTRRGGMPDQPKSLGETLAEGDQEEEEDIPSVNAALEEEVDRISVAATEQSEQIVELQTELTRAFTVINDQQADI
ncbi:MAG: hypothetical protein QKN93_gp1, partial [Narnavirus sp.]